MAKEKPFKSGDSYDTYMNEMEWDDACSDARYILDEMEKRGKTIIWLTAGKIDWQGHSGFKIGTIEEICNQKSSDGDIWSWISGINGDWTLRFVEGFDPDEDSKMLMMCSHHDQPMGGERVVTFYSPKEFYDLAISHGMKLKDMQEWLFDNNLVSYEDADEATVIECLGVMKHEDLQDFIDS